MGGLARDGKSHLEGVRPHLFGVCLPDGDVFLGPIARAHPCHGPRTHPALHHTHYKKPTANPDCFGLNVWSQTPPSFTPSRRAPDSALWPIGSSLDSHSLGSTMVRHPSGCTRLPRLSASALVHCHSSFDSDFRVSGYTSALHPSGSAGLLLLSGSALAFLSYGVTPGLRLLCSTWVSPTYSSTSVGQAPGSIMAPSSIGSTVALCPNASALGCFLAHPSVISSLAPSSKIYSLVPPSSVSCLVLPSAFLMCIYIP